jgi:AraC family transcriptional regulator, transcriptional activator of pobA
MVSARKNPIQILTGSPGMIRAREIISGQYDEYRSAKFIEPHRRNFYSFFLVKQGYIKHSIDFTSYTCSQGDIFFMAPQQVYLVDAAEDFAGISINCQPEILDPAELNLPVIRNIFLYSKVSPASEDLTEMRTLAERMVHIFHDDSPFSNELMSAHLRLFLIYLSRSWVMENPIIRESPEQAAIVEKFRELINLYWKEPMQVPEYASRLHITSGHLNTVVKANTGKSAKDLIHEKKLIEAKRLLIHTVLSVKEIAFETGFDDPAYFGRFFKKWNNTTPLEFRDQIHEKYWSSPK